MPKLESINKDSIPNGINHLLVIAIEKYQHVGQLQNCIRDANAIIEVLTQKYRFNSEHVQKLYNQEATRENILETLHHYRTRVNPNDTLIIYFSGHGEVDGDTGYWIPIEASQERYSQYISSYDIKSRLDRIDAFHTLVIVDACFAGAIFLRPKNITPGTDSNRSRWGLVSSNDRQVASDGSPGSNSPFVISLLKHLRTNEDDIGLHLLASKVIDDMRRFNQTPVCQPLNVKGHELGQFVFKLRGMDTFVDPRDGKVYKTIEVNSKIWMAQNLDFDIGEGCFYYGNEHRIGPIFGRLYTWEAARKACPPGWRIPSVEEWKDLIEILGGEFYKESKVRSLLNYLNKKKKIPITIVSSSPSPKYDASAKKSTISYQSLIEGGGSNLDVLLGGYYNSERYSNLGEIGFYWTSSTVSVSEIQYNRELRYNETIFSTKVIGIIFENPEEGVGLIKGNISFLKEKKAFSCRCIRDI